ncbi:MAG: tetratricopeptide repeat protein [Rhodocyclales bacterium]|nr:tetratricopeptide repeat protein [Rhodocyclales bacterium]
MSNTRKQQLGAQVGRALQLHQSGDLDAAEALYKQVLGLDPEHADALHLYGCLADSRGQDELAVSLISRAVRANRDAYPFHCNLANILARQGRLDDAIRHYRAALRIKPDFAIALNNLGTALERNNDRAAAVLCYRKAIRYQPAYPDPHYNLGLALKADGDLDAAIAAYQEVIHLRPSHVGAHYNLGNAHALAQRPVQAVAAYRAALALQADDPRIHTNLGGTLMKLGQLETAIQSFERALQLDAKDMFAQSNLIQAASYASDDPAELRAQCERWCRTHAVVQEGVSHANTPDMQRRLRVGYVSADFHLHAASYWIEPLFAGHDHDVCEIHCYSNGERHDDVTKRLMARADAWVDCATLDDDALAARIRADGIDILVDLSGHTEGHRLPVFARKPAPVQISWLGFPGSTGLPAMDYRFTDAVMDPPGVEPYYAEELVRLSFNNLAKITPPMLKLWCRILGEVPDARLLFQGAGLDDPDLARDVIARLEQEGVAPERVQLLGWQGMQGYLALGQQADIALDPFPFNGGVTTFHALWMGLPVVTLSGRSAASRVGRSILSGIGLPELAVEDEAAYVSTAVALARDAERLATLRGGLRERLESSGLTGGATLAREVEDVYRRLWRRWCESAAGER